MIERRETMNGMRQYKKKKTKKPSLPKLTPFKHNAPLIKRNDKCPCGRGLKFKRCCMVNNPWMRMMEEPVDKTEMLKELGIQLKNNERLRGNPQQNFDNSPS